MTYALAQNVKNEILEFRPLYFAQKCPQNTGNDVSETQNSNFFQGGIHVPPDLPTNVSFNNVTYFVPPKKS